MKNYVLLLYLLSVSFNAIGQTATNTEGADSSNVYFHALEFLVQAYSNNTEKQLFIEESRITTKGLPSELLGKTITYVDGRTLFQMTKRNENLQLFRIIPLRLSDGVFFVNIIGFEVSRSKKRYDYINKGGFKLSFKYDCDSGTLVLSKIE